MSDDVQPELILLLDGREIPIYGSIFCPKENCDWELPQTHTRTLEVQEAFLVMLHLCLVHPEDFIIIRMLAEGLGFTGVISEDLEQFVEKIHVEIESRFDLERRTQIRMTTNPLLAPFIRKARESIAARERNIANRDNN